MFSLEFGLVTESIRFARSFVHWMMILSKKMLVGKLKTKWSPVCKHKNTNPCSDSIHKWSSLCRSAGRRHWYPLKTIWINRDPSLEIIRMHFSFSLMYPSMQIHSNDPIVLLQTENFGHGFTGSHSLVSVQFLKWTPLRWAFKGCSYSLLAVFVYPSLQMQLYDPIVSTHSAFPPQMSGCSQHSLLSKIRNEEIHSEWSEY